MIQHPGRRFLWRHLYRTIMQCIAVSTGQPDKVNGMIAVAVEFEWPDD
jgi:hypothetical protein